ncbi:hypothetical protein [Cellulosimicrobium cellulans]|uniref:hypothetical protein n=1 Tax=Cellulosimicrobium cellulans TaxID=1710 RepID=UPI00240558AD|nr:hypothetical protein [Cellulosimicrobium cellulans]MDF9877472.1 hypothetical protein [Cellulosimicrobium cellulans]
MSSHRRRPNHRPQKGKHLRYEPAWDYDYVHPEPAPEQRWQDAWAETTLRVCEMVWNKQAYRVHPLDPIARDDLWSWLWVRAVEFSERFTPKKTHEAEDHWAASLYSLLVAQVRWHWAEYHGLRAVRNEDGARRLVPTDSIDQLLERASSGPSMHHVAARMSQGSLSTYRPISPEQFVLMLELAEETQGPETYTPKAPDLCIEDGCAEPARRGGAGRCARHYSAHRRLWAMDHTTCLEEGCDLPQFSKGRCPTHYKAAHREDPTRPRCIEPGCDRSVDSRGLCNTHLAQWRRAGKELPPARQRTDTCTVEGCTNSTSGAKICGTHRYRLKKYGTTDLPPKRGAA